MRKFDKSKIYSSGIEEDGDYMEYLKKIAGPPSKNENLGIIKCI